MAAKERGEEDRDAFERDGGWAGHGAEREGQIIHVASAA